MLLENAKKCLQTEADAILALKERLGADFSAAAAMILNCSGRVVVCGMGKSGHIGRKISATLASTGTPSFFLHPAEAIHGDLGMVTADDIVIAISNSGETEIMAIVPALKRIGAKIIAMTGRTDSSLAKVSEYVLDCSVQQEACPLGLAPTSSTTATLAFGDALAVALLSERGFTPADFALYHPGGSLGKKLLLKVSDLMHQGENNPVIAPDKTVREALFVITAKGLGAVNIVDEKGVLQGLITDGVIRRGLERSDQLLNLRCEDIMVRNPKVARSGEMAVEALNRMERNQPTPITVLPVVDEAGCITGMIHMTDLVRSGIV